MWYYVLSIKGCRRDDYDYAEVNKLLNIDLKRFIKKVCCMLVCVLCIGKGRE